MLRRCAGSQSRPGAGGPWRLSVAPLGPANVASVRGVAMQTRGWMSLAIVGSPVGASECCVGMRGRNATQGKGWRPLAVYHRPSRGEAPRRTIRSGARIVGVGDSPVRGGAANVSLVRLFQRHGASYYSKNGLGDSTVQRTPWRVAGPIIPATRRKLLRKHMLYSKRAGVPIGRSGFAAEWGERSLWSVRSWAGSIFKRPLI